MEYSVRHQRPGEAVFDLPEGANVVAVVDADGTDAFQAAMVVDGHLLAVGPWQATVERAALDLPELKHPAATNSNSHLREVAVLTRVIAEKRGRRTDAPKPVVVPRPPEPAPDLSTPEGLVEAVARRERIPNIDEFLAMCLELKAAGLATLARMRGDLAEYRQLMALARGI